MVKRLLFLTMKSYNIESCHLFSVSWHIFPLWLSTWAMHKETGSVWCTDHTLPPKEHSGSALQTSHLSPQKLSDPWPCWSQWDNSSLYPCSVGESSWDQVSCTTGLLTLSQGNRLGLLQVTFPTIFNYPNLGITFLPFPGMWLNSNKITI